ncbi:MAG: hypothetical protein JO227_11225 [Acetobacteraceae bacterium]|nr:hypothetical protein [Acetobacteraceae bacterium]
MSADYQIFELGDVRLQSGATIRGCRLAYKTFGTLSPAKDNAIVYPTWYSGQHYTTTSGLSDAAWRWIPSLISSSSRRRCAIHRLELKELSAR